MQRVLCGVSGPLAASERTGRALPADRHHEHRPTAGVAMQITALIIHVTNEESILPRHVLCRKRK